MYIGTSFVLIALGAILHYAVNEHVAGIDIQTAGTILMVVGILCLLISLWLEVLAYRRRGAVAVDYREPETGVTRRLR